MSAVDKLLWIEQNKQTKNHKILVRSVSESEWIIKDKWFIHYYEFTKNENYNSFIRKSGNDLNLLLDEVINYIKKRVS